MERVHLREVDFDIREIILTTFFPQTLGIFHMSKLDVSPEDALTYFAPLKAFLADSLNTTLTATVSPSYGEFHEKFLHKSSEGLVSPLCPFRMSLG